MDVRSLRYFICVAQMENISKAAIRLHLAQPALSRQIKQLENELGVPLFQRTTHGVHITEDGRHLLERAKPVVQQCDELSHDFKLRAQSIDSSITIGMQHGLGRLLLSNVMEKFKTRCPATGLKIRIGMSGSIRQWLLRGDVDIALVYSDVAKKMLKIQYLIDEPLVFVGPLRKWVNGAPPPKGNVISLEQIEKLPLILPSGSHELRRQIDRAFKKAGFRIKPILEVDEFSLMRDLIEQGAGYTLFTFSSIAADGRIAHVKAWKISDPGIKVTLTIAYSLKRQISKPLSILAQILQEDVKRLASERRVVQCVP